MSEVAMRHLVLVLLLPICCACDPRQEVELRVLSRGQSVPGAQVELHCPKDWPWQVPNDEVLGTTDELGELRYSGLGSTPKHCELRASIKGRTSPGTVVESVCSKGFMVGSCLRLKATLRID